MVEIIKVAQIFEEEKIAYGKEMAEQAAKQAAEQAAKKLAEATRNIVKNLLKDGMSPKKVVQVVSDITLEEVEALEKELLQTV